MEKIIIFILVIVVALPKSVLSTESGKNSTKDASIDKMTVNVINVNESVTNSALDKRQSNETLKTEAQSQNPYLNQRTQSPGVAGVIPFVGPFLGPVLSSLGSARRGGAYSPETLAAARQRAAQPGAGLNPFGILNLDNFIPGGAGNARQRLANQANRGGLFGQPQLSAGNNDVSNQEGNQPEEEQADGQDDAQGSQEGQDPSQDPDLQQFQNLRGSNFPADLFPPGVLSAQDLSDIQKGIEEQQKREAEKQRQQEAEQEQPEEETNEADGGNDSSGGEEADKDTSKDTNTNSDEHTGNERDAIGDKRNRNSPYGTPVPIQPLTPSPIQPIQPIQPQLPYSPLPPLTPLTNPNANLNQRDLYGRRQTTRNPYPDYDYDRPQPRRRPGVLYRNEEPNIYNRYDRLADRRLPPRPRIDEISPRSRIDEISPRSRIEENDYRYPRRDDYSSIARRRNERIGSRVRFDDDDEVNAYPRLPRRPVVDSAIDRDYIRRREDELYRRRLAARDDPRRLAARDDPRRYRTEFGGQGQYSNVKVNADTGVSPGVSYDDENSINETLPGYPVNYYNRQNSAPNLFANSNYTQRVKPRFDNIIPTVEYTPRNPRIKLATRNNLNNHRLSGNYGEGNLNQFSQNSQNPSRNSRPYIPPYSAQDYQTRNYPEANINTPNTHTGHPYTDSRGLRRNKGQTIGTQPVNNQRVAQFGPVTPPAFLPYDPSYGQFINNGNYQPPIDDHADRSSSGVEYDSDNDVNAAGNRGNAYVTRGVNTPNTAQRLNNNRNSPFQSSITSKAAQRNSKPFLNA